MAIDTVLLGCAVVTQRDVPCGIDMRSAVFRLYRELPEMLAMAPQCAP